MRFLVYHWIMARKQHLVHQHLENVSYDLFVKYAPLIARYVQGRNGIYALYKGEDLYYVGLAVDLRRRIKQHMADRHGTSWDRFSVYLTQGDHFLKEMESLILRIILPQGNRVKGRLTGSRDLKADLQRHIKEMQKMELVGLLGRKVRPAKSSGTRGADKTDALADRLVYLRRDYKGHTYRATWRSDGTVKYQGEIYDSLSAAGSAAAGRGVNGRTFWRVRNADLEWVPINDVDKPARKKRANSGDLRGPVLAIYKGQKYKGTLRAAGQVRYNGKTYPSLAATGRAITGRNVHGRHFWRMKDGNGSWVRIKELGP